MFKLTEEDLKPSTRVCSRHFPDGDASKIPNVNLGKRFASPMKQGPRAKRAKERDELRQLRESSLTSASECSHSRSVTPAPSTPTPEIHTTVVGEQLSSDYSVHEIPTDPHTSSEHIEINHALLTRIEFLEAENASLKTNKNEKGYFRLEDI